MKKISNLVQILILTAPLFWLSNTLQAASVLKCSQKTQQCKIRLEEGFVGARVQVLDEKAHVIATGWLIKRQNSFGIIAFKKIVKPIRKGYPVLIKLDNQDSNLQWAATFPDLD